MLAFAADGARSRRWAARTSLAIDPSGQHALIAYTGNIARIDLSTGQLTELPLEENGAHAIAW